LEWFRIGRQAALDQLRDFLEPARLDHRLDARMDSPVERFARREQANFDNRVTFERRAAAAMNFRDGLAGEEAHLEGANCFLGVLGGDTRRGFGVETGKQAMKVRRAVNFRAGAQALTNRFGAFRDIGEAFEQGAQVEAGPGGEDGKFFAFAETGEDREGAAAIFARSEDFFRLDEVDKVVRDSLLFRRRNFSSANVEPPVNLGGIADDDFAVALFSEFDTQRGLAGSGGTKDYDKWREATHPENFQQRIRSPSMTNAARRSAPITWVRLGFMAWLKVTDNGLQYQFWILIGLEENNHAGLNTGTINAK
jgi:hypothetical protein